MNLHTIQVEVPDVSKAVPLSKDTKSIKDTHTTDKSPLSILTQQSQQCSPCFAEPHVPDSPFYKDELEDLLASQRFIIERYCNLVSTGIFRCGITDRPHISLAHNAPIFHGIQDPTGALFTSLLVLRRNRPNSKCWKLSSQHTRRGLAAIVSVCHKLAAHGPGIGMGMFYKCLAEQFFNRRELPVYENDWCQEFKSLYLAEFAVLEEPLYALHTQNPLAEAEIEIGKLMKRGKISKHTGSVFRGSCFFLLASPMFNVKTDVLETLAQVLTNEEIGQGCVSLLLTLWYTLGEEYGGLEIGSNEVLFRAPYSGRVDQAARVLLHEAMSREAIQLRLGPYRGNILLQETEHVVQRLVSESNLHKAAAVFNECMQK